MPSFEGWVAFFLAASVFAYVPGPSMLYASAQTIARGRRAGWFAALGIHLGGYVHVFAAAFGLAYLFQAAPTAYAVFKGLGAAYLIWLGIRMFRAPKDIPDQTTERSIPGAQRAFWESVTIEVLNPKTAVFYIAFLPQFASPDTGVAVWAQLLVLGSIVNLMFSSADAVCVLLADRISAAVRSSDVGARMAQKLGGGILIALGLGLAFDRQG